MPEIEAARAQGAPTIAITNAPGSPLARAAEHSIDVAAGPELATAATKTYTAQLLAVAALAAALPSTAATPGAQSLGEDALWRWLEFELATADLLFTGGRAAVNRPAERADELLDLPILGERLVRKPIRHNRQVGRLRLVGERRQQIHGSVPHWAEPTDADHGAIEDIGQRRVS